jgi:hypothetical protein
VFALSASLAFLDVELDIYGVINTRGLQLFASKGTNLSVPGVDFSVSESFDIVINSSQISAGTTYHYSLALHIPDIEILGVSIGSYGDIQTSLSEDCDLQVVVKYSEGDWHNDQMDFSALVSDLI